MKRAVLSLFLVFSLLFPAMMPVPVMAEGGADTGDVTVTQEDIAAAENVKQAIDDLLGEPLTEKGFQLVKGEIDEMSEGAEEYFKQEYEETWLRFSNIRQLMEYVADTELAIQRIPVMSSELTYTSFADGVARAEAAYSVYHSLFASLRQSGYECLVTADRDLFIDNFADLERVRLQLEVEEACHDVDEFTIMTDEVKEQLERLRAAVVAGEESEFQISRYSFYNADRIVELLTQYKSVTTFEEMADAISENLDSVLQLSAALSAYEYFNDLGEEIQNMIPADYIDRMMNAVRVSTGATDVEKMISEIGVVSDEENYWEVLGRYDTTYRAYESYVVRYAGVVGVTDLIRNVNVLNDQCRVLEMIKSIRKLQSVEDVTVRSWQTQMESIRHTYENMPEELKVQIYNYSDFLSQYRDVDAANEVVRSIEGIRTSFTLEDEGLVLGTRTAYNNLNDRAKSYVGSSRLAGLVFAEEQLLALHQNVAQRTIQLIEKIGTVTVSSKDSIERARKSYNALNTQQRGMVTNYAALIAAENAYQSLERDLSKASVAGLGSYTYSGLEMKPPVTVRLNGVVLVPDVDYSVSTSGKNVGTVKMTLRGIGNYTGSLTKTFTIKKETLSYASLSGLKSKYSYTGNKIKPAPVVRVGERALKKGTDYTIKYTSNKNVGKVKFTIKGRGNYSGTVKGSFKITKTPIKKVSVSFKKKKNLRSGSEILSVMRVVWNGKKLSRKKDYTASCSIDRAKGRATVILRGKGNFNKTKKITMRIY